MLHLSLYLYVYIFMHTYNTALFLLGLSKGYDDFQSRYNAIYSLLTFTNALSLFLISFGLLVYGLHLKDILRAHLNSPWDLQSNEKNSINLNILIKINMVLSVCTVCYTLRVALLCIILGDTIQGTDVSDVFPSLVWFTISNWIPLLIPVSMNIHVYEFL
jgi:hypothetical protein